MATVDKKLNKLLTKVDKVIDEQKEISHTEKILLDAVATDIQEDRQIAQEVRSVEKVTFLQKLFIRKMKRHEILFAIIVLMGVVLVWRGLWGIFDTTPVISYSVVSLFVGLFLLWLFDRIKSL